MPVLVTFQTLRFPFQGCSVLMSTDWLIVRVPPRFGRTLCGSAWAASRSRTAPGAPPAAAAAAARPACARNRRREMDDFCLLGPFLMPTPSLVRLRDHVRPRLLPQTLGEKSVAVSSAVRMCSTIHP